MKVSGEGAPKRTETEKKKSHLADYLEPNEDEEDEEDSDSGEIIDRSELSAFSRGESLMISAGARTEYYDLPSKRPARGTPYTVDEEEDDGTAWPAPR